MKKRLSFIIGLTVALTLALASAVYADDIKPVKLDKTTFPDDAFRTYVTDTFDKDEDGELSAQEIEKATGLLGFEEEEAEKIHDFTGIEYLTELNYVDISGCEVEKLDLSKNVKIASLFCRNCKMETLNLKGLERLKFLSIENTKLPKLDISGNPKLQTLYCMNCGLKSLQLGDAPELTELNCSQNKLSSLDLSKNTKLRIVFCDQNKLKKAPDVSKNTKLMTFHCTGNGFRTISDAVLKKQKFEYTGKPVTFGKENVTVHTDAPGEIDAKLRETGTASKDEYEMTFVEKGPNGNSVSTSNAQVIIKAKGDDLAGIVTASFGIRPPVVQDAAVTVEEGEAIASWSVENGKEAKVSGYEVWYKVEGNKAFKKISRGAAKDKLIIRLREEDKGKQIKIKVRAIVTGINGTLHGGWSKSSTAGIK